MKPGTGNVGIPVRKHSRSDQTLATHTGELITPGEKLCGTRIEIAFGQGTRVSHPLEHNLRPYALHPKFANCKGRSHRIVGPQNMAWF